MKNKTEPQVSLKSGQKHTSQRNEQNQKSITFIISQYVDRNDVKGLAEYFRAYITDELLEKEQKDAK